MKKNKILYITIIKVFCFSYLSFAQAPFLPPSSENIALIKGSKDDVDLYTGKGTVNIPLATIKQRDLEINIALKYIGASGIKVQEIAGSSGLGWALLAGGVITGKARTDGPQELMNSYASWLNSTPGSADFSKAFTLTNDNNDINSANLELDEFNSSIGGRIVFDRNKIPFFSNDQGFKIEQNGVYDNSHCWIISDSKGNKYYFGFALNERERVGLYGQEGRRLSDGICAWHLSKITSPAGAQIDFEYEKSGQIVESTYYTPSLQKEINIFGKSNFIPSQLQQTSTTLNEEIHLAKIKTNDKIFQFSYVDRLDLIGEKALSSIIISDAKQSIITKYEFEMDYFKSSVVNPELRLKLNEIKKYNRQQDKTNLIASFRYNEIVPLPPRNSNSFDHWGYFNSNNTGTPFLTDGANKTADVNRSQSNILTQIDWPTGGSTQYLYELNDYIKGGQLYSGGGVRVKSIKQVDKSNAPIITLYSYVDDLGNSSGLSNSLFDVGSGYVSSFHLSNMGNSSDIVSESASPINQVVDLNGISVGYSMVTVEYPDHSKEKYYFQDFAQYPDQINCFNYSNFPFSVTSFQSMPFNSIKHSGLNRFTSNALQRGLLKEKDVITGTGLNLQKTIYQYDTAIIHQIPASQVKPYCSFVISESTPYPGAFMYSSLFYEKSESVRIRKVEVKNYTPAGSNLAITQIVQKEYGSPVHPSLLTKDITLSSLGDSLITEYHYPFEFIGMPASAMSEMNNNNMLIPIEKIRKVFKNSTSSVTGADLIFYRTTPQGFVVPDNSRKLEISKAINDFQPLNSSGNFDQRFRVEMSYNKYGDKGQLLQYTKAEQLPTTLIWDESKSINLANVVNASSERVIFDNAEGVYGTSPWDGGDGGTLVNDAYSGRTSYRLSNFFKVLPAGRFIIRYRFKGPQATISANGINFLKTQISQPDLRGWKTYQAEFTIPSATNLTIAGVSDLTQLIDDICVYPFGAQINYSSSEPFVGLTSITHPNGVTAFYEYDDFQRLHIVRDHNWNVIRQTQYNLVYNPNWKDTGTKVCLTNINGYNTGESQMLQKDNNPISSTYNQTRLRSLGHSYSCLPIFYAKFVWGATSDWQGAGGVQSKVRDFAINLYYDQACTIPADFLLDIDMKIIVTTSGNCGSSVTTYSPAFHGPTLNSSLVISERNDLDNPGTWAYCNYTYQFQPTSQYVIVP